MTLAQRGWHRRLWALLAVVVAACLWWALSIRSNPATIAPDASAGSVQP